MSKEVFTKEGFNIQELEARHELSIVAPGDLAAEAAKKGGDERCSGNSGEVDLSLAENDNP